MTPPGLSDAGRIAYTLRCLLCPQGLDPVLEGVSSQPAAAELGWPGRPGRVAIDLQRLQEAFTILSGEREFAVPHDPLGRVSAEALGADCSRPHLTGLARTWADSLATLNPAWRRPVRRAVVFLTHDVDQVNPLQPMGLAGQVVRLGRGLLRGDATTARRLVRWISSAGRFAETYEQIMCLEREAGAVATYFFMAGPYSFRRYGSRSGRGRRLRRLAGLVRQYGHRVGLHGCVYSLAQRDYDRQRRDLEVAAGCQITWHRNHYLVFDSRVSSGLLESAGFRVDTTCGFHDANGFRAGVAHPYPLWDWRREAATGLTEIPLVFMDVAGDLASDTMWRELYDRLDAAVSMGGAIAILFHVDNFVIAPKGFHRYAELLGYLKSRGAILDADVAGETVTAEGPEHG